MSAEVKDRGAKTGAKTEALCRDRPPCQAGWACPLEPELTTAVGQLQYLRKRRVRASDPEVQTFILFHTD